MLSTYELPLVVLSVIVAIACSYAALWLTVGWRKNAIAPSWRNVAESQRRHDTLIDSLPGIVFSANNDPNWTMIYLSEGCFNLTGYHSFELVGTQGGYNAITQPEDLPTVLQSIDAAIANQQPYVVEYRIKTKSGQYKWLWEKGSSVFSDSGQLLGLEGFITDITKLKDSQEGLRQAEAKYRSIFENAIEGIFQTTTDGKYISANPALARIYGYDSPQALVAELVDIDRQLYVEPHRRQEFVRLIQQHGEVSGFESKVYRRDGSIIWISENVRTVKDASGAAIYYEGTVEDISDRKQLSDRLESRVQERTAQLSKANYQLQSEIVERQKAEQEVRLLQAMTQAISESPDFHSALRVALQKICKFTGWSFGEAWIPCSNSQNLSYSCSWYSNQKLAEFSNASKKITFAADVGLPGRVWASKQPEWIEDVSIAGNNIFLRASLAKQVGIKAGLGVPIVGFTSGEATEVLAVLVFFMFDSCHEDKRQVELVRAIATGLATLMQRKRAESALKKSEERYRAVVEQTSEGIFLIDTETKRILQSNAAFERLLGYTSEEILQLQIYDLIALDPEIIDKNVLRVLQKQHDFIAEAPHRRKDNSLVWTEVNVTCIFYNERNVFCAIVRDITDRKIAELALYSSLATNRALINAIPDLIFRFNREGVFVNFKAAKDSELLLPPDCFIGKNVCDVMPSAIAQLTMHHIQQALSTNEIQIFEYQLQLEELRDYEARLVVSAQDEVMAIVRDITERKRAEADMHHALAKEKELSLLKSRFVTMTSHEFRTPLTTILSSAELLQKYSFKWSEEKKLQHFWRIQTAVKHMTQLLEDVLLIGKAEAEKLEFQPSSLDLRQFCADLANEIQTLTQKHQITFVSQSDRTLGQMDEKLLRHIFSNLLVNAVKYSPQGGEVKFELVCEQDTAIFRIQDSGIGIPENEQAKLFDSFHRASNVGTISGTGLGLAIVKKSVDLHAGKIEVESQVGIGTTFIVSLPLNC